MECEKKIKCKLDRKSFSSKSQTGYDIIVSMKKNIEKMIYIPSAVISDHLFV